MALSKYHVTHTGGLTMIFGDDIVDGWPIQVALVNHQEFFSDPHDHAMARLRLSAALSASACAAGSGSVQAAVGTQNAWFRQRSGVPTASGSELAG